jgi:sec-independent protein translocase protein TatC
VTHEPYTDDLFRNSRMPFGDHIEELRWRLWRALGGFCVGLVVGFFVSPFVLEWIRAPIEKELAGYYLRRAQRLQKTLAENPDAADTLDPPRAVRVWVPRRALGIEGDDPDATVPVTVRVRLGELALKLLEAELAVSDHPSLASFTITEPVVVYFKVSIYCGIVLASPWIFWQLWMFVAAGLYPHERRFINWGLPASVFLFVGGVLFCEIVVVPRAIAYLLEFGEWVGVEPELRLSEWLSFAILMPLVFGVAFETPLVMFALQKLGILDVADYRRHRRLAFFLLAVLAAVLTVTPDPVNMLWLAAPMWGLYELGILFCWLAPRRAEIEEEEMAEDLVEV